MWMKHPGHTYGGFVSAISERGMTDHTPNIDVVENNGITLSKLRMKDTQEPVQLDNTH
jgi:hypothetical protein